MIKYSWEPGEFRFASHAGAPAGLVERVYFVLTGLDTATGRSQALNGSLVLAAPADDAEIVPFGQLTRKQVVNWLSKRPEAARMRDQVALALAIAAAEEAERAAAGEQAPAALAWPWQEVSGDGA